MAISIIRASEEVRLYLRFLLQLEDALHASNMSPAQPQSNKRSYPFKDSKSQKHRCNISPPSDIYWIKI